MSSFQQQVLLALAAVAVAEPDAQYLYGYPYGYAGAAHATAGLVTYANGAVTPVDTLSVQAAKAQHFAAKAVAAPYYGGYYGAHLIGKREAEADPQLLLGSTYGLPYASYGYNYGAYGYHYTYGARFIGKREAEAEPEADAQFLYGNPYLYANPHTSVGLTAYYNGAVTPTKTLAVQAAEASHFAAKAVAAPYYGGYYGAHLIGKREAEAKPQYYYGGYPYATYGAAYGYPYTYGAYSYLG